MKCQIEISGAITVIPRTAGETLITTSDVFLTVNLDAFEKITTTHAEATTIRTFTRLKKEAGAVAMAGAAGGALYGLPVRAQLREIRLTEQALPEFIRNIAEYRKIRYNMKRAIIETSEQAKFNLVFDPILSRIVAQLNLGVRLGEVKVAIRSWLGRTTLFILDQIGESGGGTPANTEDLYNFISSYNRLRREATASVKLYRVIGFSVPVAIPIVVKIIGSIVSSFGSSTGGFLEEASLRFK